MEPILRVIAVRELSFKYFYSEFWYFLYFDVVGLLILTYDFDFDSFCIYRMYKNFYNIQFFRIHRIVLMIYDILLHLNFN